MIDPEGLWRFQTFRAERRSPPSQRISGETKMHDAFLWSPGGLPRAENVGGPEGIRTPDKHRVRNSEQVRQHPATSRSSRVDDVKRAKNDAPRPSSIRTIPLDAGVMWSPGDHQRKDASRSCVDGDLVLAAYTAARIARGVRR